MVNRTLIQRLEKYQQFHEEVYLCNKDQHEALVNNPPITDAVILTCSDPRVVPSLTFLSEPGDEFVDQSIGNVFTENTAIAIRTGILVRDVKLILIMGHSDCLAMKSCLMPQLVDPKVGLHDWMGKHATHACQKASEINPKHRSWKSALKKVTQENIIDQVSKARACVEHLSTVFDKPDVVTNTLVVGLYYDLRTAKLLVYKDWDTQKPAWLNASRVLKQQR